MKKRKTSMNVGETSCLYKHRQMRSHCSYAMFKGFQECSPDKFCRSVITQALLATHVWRIENIIYIQ